MPVKVPSLRLHKASKQGYIHVAGKDIYLGVWGQPETDEAYRRIIAEHLTTGTFGATDPESTLVSQLCAEYLMRAKTYYVDSSGKTTNQLSIIKCTIKVVLKFYASVPIKEFKPRQLKTLQQCMIEEDIARPTINKYCGVIKHMFKWGVTEGTVPIDIYQALTCVEGLRANRSAARETEPIRPVPDDAINAIRDHVSAQVWAMIQLQLLSAARPGELVELRPCDIEVSGAVWVANLTKHKTAYKGKSRLLHFGPQAQAILKPWLLRPTDAFLFSPKEAESARNARADSHRSEKQKPTPRKTKRTLGDCYTVNSYRRTIARACVAAKITSWHPHQLRHSAATKIRKEFGLEAAQVILGHASADITQIYAERDNRLALEIIARFG